jgi:hypothetical protein
LPDKLDFQKHLLALKKVSEALLHQLQQDMTAMDTEAVETYLQQREQIIADLTQTHPEEREAFQKAHSQLVSDTQRLGEQCISALQDQGLALSETRRQMTHGRHLLQTYQPEAEQQSHFIEDDV